MNVVCVASQIPEAGSIWFQFC